MVNLVSPVNVLEPIEERIIEFKGLNRKPVIEDGEMSDMLNLTSDAYPLLTQRKARGRMRLPSGAIRPIQLMAMREKIALIARREDGYAFYYDGERIDEVEDVDETTRMVSINTKICFFPQKKYLIVDSGGNIPSENAYGSLDFTFTISLPLSVTLGSENATINLGTTHDFHRDDAITTDATIRYKFNGSFYEKPFETSFVIDDVDGNNIIVPSEVITMATEVGATNITITSGSIERTMPELDYVAEWNNRLWGCSTADNTIYASKLGDPTNWQYYQGTSLDSFYAQQGTDGDWTGIGKHSNHLIFFKQDSLCRVYGTAPSNYQIDNMEAFGVEKGSADSIATINDEVFYKSKIGIMVYSGSTPACVSDKLNVEARDVVAGTEKRKYYASIHTKGGGYELMVLDIDKAVWHKEDNTRFRSCATIGDRLHYVEYDADLLACSVNLPCSDWLLVGSENIGGSIGIVNPINAYEDANTIKWKAVFGPFDEYIEEHKIYSKLAFRVQSKGEEDSDLVNEDGEKILIHTGEAIGFPNWLKVYISIDEGDWEEVDVRIPPTKKGDFIPIIPRRCDRYSVKLEGEGLCDIKTLTRRIRKGSFGRL